MEVKKMGFIGDIIDWAADKVQTATGEKERREWVQRYKNTYFEFKNSVEIKVKEINEKIEDFNLLIQRINLFRKQKIEKNIIHLGRFLGKFGNVKPIGSYTEEKESFEISLPEKQFETKEQYISEIDWSKDEVFLNTFFCSPIGMAIKTKSQNLSIQEQFRAFELEAEETLKQFELKKIKVVQDKKIADIYIYCVGYITEYIKKVIIPELDVVEAFLQSLSLKNEVIAEQSLSNIKFTNNIRLLKGTQYERHFMFVKNAFMFYVISCKIYTTPILTKLIKGNIQLEDVKGMEENRVVLCKQKENVDKYIMFNREG